MAFSFNNGDRRIDVEFKKREIPTKALIRQGILQARKSKAKMAADAPTRQCIVCMIKDRNGPLATGLSVCSPIDTFKQQDGEKHALARAIAHYRNRISTEVLLSAPKTVTQDDVHGTVSEPQPTKLVNLLNRESTIYLWDAFHKSHTPDAIKSYNKGQRRRKGF
jgi:hypothetical protein